VTTVQIHVSVLIIVHCQHLWGSIEPCSLNTSPNQGGKTVWGTAYLKVICSAPRNVWATGNEHTNGIFEILMVDRWRVVPSHNNSRFGLTHCGPSILNSAVSGIDAAL